jgi:hypothetical protein
MSRIEVLCPGVKPGDGRLKACLQQQGKTVADVCPGLAGKRAKDQPQSGGANPSIGTNTAPGGFPSQAPVAQQPGSDNR